MKPSPLAFGTTVTRRSLLVGAGIATIGAGLESTRAVAATPVSVALDWYPNANHAGLYWAASEGLFAAADLDVTLRTPADPSAVLQTVAGGRDTFGISYQPDILLARSVGVPIVAVASIVPRPLLGVMSLASSGITSPADLKGATVGYPGIPAQEAFLRTILREQNLSLDDIQLVNVEFNLLPSLISGQAKAVMGAYWTHETFVAEEEGYPVDLLKVDDWGVPAYDELVLVASEQTVAENSDLVSAVCAAMTAGYQAAANDQAKALTILQAASDDFDLVVETQGLALLARIWINAGPALGTLNADRWQTFATWMVGEGLIPEDADLGEYLFAPAVVEPAATPSS